MRKHFLFALLTVLFSFSTARAAEWKHPLWLGRGGIWTARTRLTLTNTSDKAVEGIPFRISPLPRFLAGCRAEEIRLTNNEGTELLYALEDKGKLFTSGIIPASASVWIPAVLPPRASASFYLYTNNPKAWELADHLAVKPVAENPKNVRLLSAEGETLSLTCKGTKEPWAEGAKRGRRGIFGWLKDKVNGEPPIPPAYLYRIPITVANVREQAGRNVLASFSYSQCSRSITQPRFLLTSKDSVIPVCRIGDLMVFTCSLPPRTVKTFYLYVGDSRIPDMERRMLIPACFVGDRRKTTCTSGSVSREETSIQGSVIPSDQILSAKKELDTDAFVNLLSHSANLVENPDFENGEKMPCGWTHSKETKNTSFGLSDNGFLGKHCARFTLSSNPQENWQGWYQSVPVKAKCNYLFGAMISCKNLKGKAEYNAHVLDAKGNVLTGGYLGAGPSVSGTEGWRPMFSMARMPEGAVRLQIHLTMNTEGTLYHDGVFLAECLDSECGEVEPLTQAEKISVWCVPPVVKVFPESTQESSFSQAPKIYLARNEEEAVQVVIRSTKHFGKVSVTLTPPQDKKGNTLRATVGHVGYVPIDHKSSYYSLTTPTYTLHYPNNAGSGDGWSGRWPDPIVPSREFQLMENVAQPVWISFKTDAYTPAGEYRTSVRFMEGERLLEEQAISIRVWNFSLPVTPSFSAIYDLRGDSRWCLPGEKYKQSRLALMRFLAEKRLCPDSVGVNLSFTRGADGKISCDFAEYDKAASLYFDTYHFRTSYTPNFFYCFGWGLPPTDCLGEKPYDGAYPYADTDREKLRDGFKKTYQECLRLYWDHIKAKGWSDRLILYISDEPHFSLEIIRKQMKALCAMIHEVDPKIQIYCSTWRHCPEWNDSLDIWGVGHYGCFPVAEMAARKKDGKRIWFTTDGQMCTDTPFCAVERLLPHYAFKYGADAYEFWGIDWLTYDPWKFGWHRYIPQTDTPGKSYHVRYPNGDGFLMYPGKAFGVNAVTSVRMEAARDGEEDYEYLLLLRKLAEGSGAGAEEAKALLADFSGLVSIPNSGGRYSTKILPDPARLTSLRLRAGTLLDHYKK